MSSRLARLAAGLALAFSFVGSLVTPPVSLAVSVPAGCSGTRFSVKCDYLYDPAKKAIDATFLYSFSTTLARPWDYTWTKAVAGGSPVVFSHDAAVKHYDFGCAEVAKGIVVSLAVRQTSTGKLAYQRAYPKITACPAGWDKGLDFTILGQQISSSTLPGGKSQWQFDVVFPSHLTDLDYNTAPTVFLDWALTGPVGVTKSGSDASYLLTSDVPTWQDNSFNQSFNFRCSDLPGPVTVTLTENKYKSDGSKSPLPGKTGQATFPVPACAGAAASPSASLSASPSASPSAAPAATPSQKAPPAAPASNSALPLLALVALFVALFVALRVRRSRRPKPAATPIEPGEPKP
jgi:hypothetical protein